VLQAFVSEGIKPAIDHVVTFGAGHFYISQSDKGGLVFGGDIDGYNSYAWRGNLPTSRRDGRGHGDLARPRAHPHAAPVGRADGHVDGRLADHRPHAGRRALSQLRLVLRRLQGDARVRLVLRASDRARRALSVAAALRLDRYATGALIDERGAGAQPNMH
jgi:sarcosine oxidase subunit beta